MMSGRIILWDSRTGKKRREIQTEYQISSLVFSPDGKELAARSIYAEVGFWNVSDVGPVREFSLGEPSYAPVPARGMSLVFAPDGKALFVQRRGKLWESLAAIDVATGKQRCDFGATGCNTVRGLAVSPDGKTLALGAPKPSVRLYDVASGRIVWSMNEHGGKDTDAVTFRPDGEVLASGSVGKIVLSDPENGKTLGVLKGPMGYIVGLAFTPDGRTLLSGSAEGTIHVWDVEGKKERYRLDAHADGQALALSHDGKTVALSTNRNLIRLWDVATGRERFPDDTGHDAGIQALAFSPDGKQIVSADSALQVRRWDGATGQTLSRFRDQDTHSRRPALTADGSRLAILDWPSRITYIWDAHTGKKVFGLRPVGKETVQGIAFAPDGQTLITAGWPSLHVWDAATGRHLGTLTVTAEMDSFRRRVIQHEWPFRLTLAPGGKTVAVDDPAGRGMWLYDLEKSRPRFTLEEPSGSVGPATFSPDGRTVATVNQTGRCGAVRLWEVATGEAAFRWPGVGNHISTLAFSSDGRFVAAANEPYSWRKDVEEVKTIRLWDTATGRELGQFRGQDSYVRALAFSPDGTKLLAGLSNSTILVWDTAALTRQAGSPRTGPGPRELSALWNDLGSADARKARQAVWELAAVPRQAVPFLKERLRPVPGIERHQVAAWIAALDSDRFDEREEATRQLELLEEFAEPALRAALANGPSLEVRRRIEYLLHVLGRPPAVILQKLRAVEALEKMGTSAAISLLRTLVGGAAGARLTREAKASLERLNRRGVGEP